ncbi:MAG: DUF58 domain-containing protein [Thiohalomonadales bacterium]
MIKQFLQKYLSRQYITQTDSARKDKPGQEDRLDGKIFISAKALIAMRCMIQNTPSRLKKIRSKQMGQYFSPFKGRGMEFDEVRLYQAGDDVRNLDWRVTARTGKAHTKLYREERERAVLLWIDFQRSMYFGTRGSFKTVVAAKAAAHVAWSALKRGDRLGYLLFNEGHHIEQRPKGGKWSVLHFLQQVADATMNQAHYVESTELPPIEQAMQRLRKVALPGSKIILLSDFREFDQKAMRPLASLAKHNDIVIIFIYDWIEQTLPPDGIYRFSEGDKYISLDTDNKDTSMRYAQRFEHRQQQLQSFCKKHAIHFSTCSTESDVAAIMANTC